MEEKKNLKIGLRIGILIAIILMLVIGLCGIYFYYNPQKENVLAKAQNTMNTNTNNNTENTNIQNQSNTNDTFECPYKKYKDKDLNWSFAGKITEFSLPDDSTNSKIIIENEVAYFESSGNKKEITSINEKAKCIASSEDKELTYLFILTDEGSIWKLGDTQNTAKELITLGKIDEFQKLTLPNKAFNMTYGSNTSKANGGPYFLLANGELINEQGIKYEELN